MSARSQVMIGTASDGGGSIMSGHTYWRVRVTANNGDSFVALNEIQMRGVPGGPTLTTGGTAFSDSAHPAGGMTADKAFDGITGDSNEAVSATGPTWSIGYQFATPVNIVELALMRQFNNSVGTARAPNAFVLEWSDDGSSYTPAASFSGQTTWNALVYNVYSI